MMHGREKSDSAIVAGKPTNKAVLTAAEPVERRAGAKGNASQQSTRRTQSRVSVSHALERIRQNRNEKNALPSHTQGGSRMPELGPYGSVRGALSNERPYRDLRNVGANYPFERSHGFPGIKEVWPPRLFAFELRRRGYAARACVTDARSARWTGCPRASMTKQPSRGSGKVRFPFNQPKSSEFGSRAAGPSTRSYKGCINWFLQQSLPSNILPRW